MPYKSPFLYNIKFNNVTTPDIWRLFSDNQKLIYPFNDSLIWPNDEHSSENENYRLKKTKVFIDKDGDKKFGPLDIFKYYLTVFTSQDATLLNDLYEKYAAGDYEIILFLEDNSTDILTNPTYFVQIGKHLREFIKKDDNFLNQGINSSRIIKQGISKKQLSNEDLGELIRYIMENGDGVYREKSIPEYLAGIASIIGTPFMTIPWIMNKALKELIDVLKKIKIEKDGWDYKLDSKEINLFFFPGYSLLRNNITSGEISKIIKALRLDLTSSISKVKGQHNKQTLQNYFNELTQLNPSLQVIGRLAAPDSVFNTNTADKQISILLPKIFDTSVFLDELIDDLVTFHLFVGDVSLIFVNAVLCGFYNSIISLVEFLLSIARIPYWLISQFFLEFNVNLEKTDEIIQLVRNFDYKATMHKVKLFYKKMAKLIEEFSFVDFISKVSLAQWGYFLGAIIEFVAEIILGVIFTAGVGAVASVVTKFGKAFQSLANIIVNIVKNFFQISKKVVFNTAELLIRILAKGADELGRLLDEIWVAIRKWVVETSKNVGKIGSVAWRYSKKYKLPSEYPRIVRANLREVVKKFGVHGEKLFLKVEDVYKIFLKEAKDAARSRNWIRDRQLISGMSHKSYPKLISTKTNFPKRELKKFLESSGIEKFKVTSVEQIKKIYSHFGEKMHPFIENRIKVHLEQLKKLNLDLKTIQSTGGLPGTHAEVRALNELLFKLEKKGLKITDELMLDIIGYNKRLSNELVMRRCADCYYILADIVMIGLK